MRASGSRGERRAKSQIVKAKAVRHSPTMNSMPQTVDHQCGFSDMTQSTEAKVMVSAYITMPAPLKFWIPTKSAGVERPASSTKDQRRSLQVQIPQRMK